MGISEITQSKDTTTFTKEITSFQNKSSGTWKNTVKQKFSPDTGNK